MKKALSHVIWIGGLADSGNTTIARSIAENQGFQPDNSDLTGMDHLKKLA